MNTTLKYCEDVLIGTNQAMDIKERPRWEAMKLILILVTLAGMWWLMRLLALNILGRGALVDGLMWFSFPLIIWFSLLLPSQVLKSIKKYRYSKSATKREIERFRLAHHLSGNIHEISEPIKMTNLYIKQHPLLGVVLYAIDSKDETLYINPSLLLVYKNSQRSYRFEHQDGFVTNILSVE